jgi:hypothetical protein
MDQKNDNYINEDRQYKAQMNCRLQTMERNLGQIALQPVQRVHQEENDGSGNQGGSDVVPFLATLSPHPKDLYILWQEYEFGIGGRKPARQFTMQERAKVNFKYCRWKIVWDVIDCLVRSGYTAQVAIDKTYDIYDQVTVSDMIKRMRQDTRNGVERVV